MVNQRGQIVLIFQENIFHVNRRYEDKTFWQCIEYRRTKCKCRCITTKSSIKISAIPHNHPPNTNKIKKKCMKTKEIQNESVTIEDGKKKL